MQASRGINSGVRFAGNEKSILDTLKNSLLSMKMAHQVIKDSIKYSRHSQCIPLVPSMQ